MNQVINLSARFYENSVGHVRSLEVRIKHMQKVTVYQCRKNKGIEESKVDFLLLSVGMQPISRRNEGKREKARKECFVLQKQQFQPRIRPARCFTSQPLSACV